MVAESLGRWYEAPLEGRGFVTTDFHGDLRAWDHVDRLFRERSDIRWWIDLGDKGDSEKRRMEDPEIMLEGDLRIYERVHRLKRDLRGKKFRNKRFVEVVGNHDLRDLELYEMLRNHRLLAQRKRRSLSALLDQIARKERWVETKVAQVALYRNRYEKWMSRLRLEDPGLSEDEAGIRFLIRVVLCQHGFAMRMTAREHAHMSKIDTLAVHLPKAGIVLAHGGIPPHPAEPWELAEAPEEVRRGFLWNRYPEDYSLRALRAFLYRAEARLLIVGHTPPRAIVGLDPEHSVIDRGLAITDGRQVTFTSGCGGDVGGRVFLEIDADRACDGAADLDVHVLP